LIGTVSAIETTPDGDIIYVGTETGYVYRIDGLLNMPWEYDKNGTPDDISDDIFDPDSAGIQVTRIGSFGRYVTEVSADHADANHVVITLGNYGNTNFVYESTSAKTDTTSTGNGSFSSIQGSGANMLPRMPVYSCIIDKYSGAVIVGTEMGIYATSNHGNSWAAESAGMPFAATFMLREEMIDVVDGSCYAIYAGTHGRGFYRTVSLTPSSCNTTVGLGDNPKLKLNHLGFYPNPVNDMAYVDITLDRPADASLHLFDMKGQEVLTKDIGYAAKTVQIQAFFL